MDNQPISSSFNTVSINSNKIYLEETRQHETVDSAWHNNIKIHKKYKEYREAFLEILQPFQSMWDGHVGPINIAPHLIELTSTYIRPIHSAIYRTSTKARESEKREIDRILKENVIDPAQIELGFTCAFRTRKRVNTTFLRRLSEVIFRNRKRFLSRSNNERVYILIGGCASNFDTRV